MKHVADWLKYTLKLALFVWPQGSIPPNLGELTEWISFLLQTVTCLKGETFRGKSGEITRQLSVKYYHYLFVKIVK